MNKNPAHLVRAEFIYRPTDLVDAFRDDSAEHEPESELFDALLAIRQDLRRAVIPRRKSHQADCGRAPTSKLAGCHIRSEPDPFHHLLDTLPGSIGNVRHAIDDPRHSLIRNPGQGSDVFHRDLFTTSEFGRRHTDFQANIRHQGEQSLAGLVRTLKKGDAEKSVKSYSSEFAGYPPLDVSQSREKNLARV